MTVKVKICGLTREEDTRAADAAGADFLGFVMAASPRQVTPLQAARISEGVRSARVAVVVNPTERELDAIMADLDPDYIQFHGDESVEAVMSTAAHYGVKVIKALSVREPADLLRADHFAASDFLLLDAKPPKGEIVRGGHGESFDWGLLRNWPRPRLWALAGGLTPDNVADAIARTQAPIVDTSSGVETAPGVKDTALIRAFLAAARR